MKRRTSQVPRKELLHVHRVSDCARFSHASQYAMGDVAFSSLYAIGTSELPVPSPAWSEVLDATSRTICAPMFSNGRAVEMVEGISAVAGRASKRCAVESA